MKQIERSGKTARIYDAFKISNFTGMTIAEIHDITCIPTSDLIVFFEKHNEKSSKEDRYICKNGKYHLLSECR